MADEADAAKDLDDLMNQIAIEEARKKARKHQAAMELHDGKCLNCDEDLEQGRFCDPGCRDDFEARVKARARR